MPFWEYDFFVGKIVMIEGVIEVYEQVFWPLSEKVRYSGVGYWLYINCLISGILCLSVKYNADVKLSDYPVTAGFGI